MNIKATIAITLLAFTFISARLMEDTIYSSESNLDLVNLFNYSDINIPEDADLNWNETNPITDIGATLGRVLFYDKQLSVNNTTACGSCHKQEDAFGDASKLSVGFNGDSTSRHSMRLVHVDFANEEGRFWDASVNGLEILATMPIKDSLEMGFSGTNGNPDIDSLIMRITG